MTTDARLRELALAAERSVAKAISDAWKRYRIEGTTDDPYKGPPYRAPWFLIDTSTEEYDVNWPGDLVAEYQEPAEAEAHRMRLIARAACGALLDAKDAAETENKYLREEKAVLQTAVDACISDERIAVAMQQNAEHLQHQAEQRAEAAEKRADEAERNSADKALAFDMLTERSARAEAAERELARARGALSRIRNYTSSEWIRDECGAALGAGA